MLTSLNALTGRAVKGTDGEIGRVTDFLFDDEKWTVRYLVVDTGGWLSVRHVLVSPYSVEASAGAAAVDKRIRVRLTKEQIRNSPPLLSRPVTRQYEATYAAYYGQPRYWVGGGLWGVGTFPAPPPGEPLAPPAPEAMPERVESEGDEHVRSASELLGFHIQALDGEIGHIDDLYMDERSWEIRYFQVDTSNWIGGKSVLIASAWARRVDWVELKLHLELTRDEVQNSPEFDRARPLAK
jgi:hypothetical protein